MEEENKLCEELKVTLQKEISLMRDVLANMYQEELALLMRDKRSWEEVIAARALILEKVTYFRTLREEATHKLTPLGSHFQPLNNCEISVMSDQLLALMGKMNSQNIRNENLYSQIGQQLGTIVVKQDSYLGPQSLPAKKKSSIATYPERS